MLIRNSSLAGTETLHPALEVMVVTRDRNIGASLSSWLSSKEGCQAVLIENTEDALRRYGTARPGLVVLDVTSGESLAALELFRRIDCKIPIVAATAHGSTARVVEAMRLGAADVVSAPFEPQDFDAALSHALTQRRKRREMSMLQQELQGQSKYTMLFGTGHVMAELRDLIDRVVDIDVPVLIRGESGTGKELVARALVASALRHKQPFVKINCAALPSELLEAELFGFERGAFTGANQCKPGKFEFANGGTIFLDEVGEIPIHLQPKLLQVLQDGHFSRLGGHGEVHSIVRVIAATNRDLDRAVIDGLFRRDLLFRLNVIPMLLPPLRERQEDIPSLAEFFLKRAAVDYNRRYAPISSEMMDECLRYRWPGNIRELENLIKRTVILCTEAPARKALSLSRVNASILVPDAAVSVPRAGTVVESPALVTDVTAPTVLNAAADGDQSSLLDVSRRAARQAEAEMITRMLQQTGGNQRQAARNLGISYKTLLYKAKEHGFRRDVDRGRGANQDER
jgi:two-component system, NtrC family, response regulator AtoC